MALFGNKEKNTFVMLAEAKHLSRPFNYLKKEILHYAQNDVSEQRQTSLQNK